MSIFLAAVLSGCGVWPSTAPDATSEELAAAFAPCHLSGDVDRGEPVGDLEHVWEWMPVVELLTVGGGDSGYLPVTVRDADGVTRDVSVYFHSIPGIRWGLEHGAAVWFGMAEPGTMSVTNATTVELVVTPSGSAFFPGGCFDHWLRLQVGEALGGGIDAALSAVPTVEASQLRKHLGIAVPDIPQSDEVILDPSTTDPDILSALDFVSGDVWVTDAVGDDAMQAAHTEHTICTRNPVGWNECFVADERAVTSGSGYGGYVDESGVLEFWLLDGDADVDHPFGKLGEIHADGRRRVDVRIDTSGIRPDGSFEGSDRVTEVE